MQLQKQNHIKPVMLWWVRDVKLFCLFNSPLTSDVNSSQINCNSPDCQAWQRLSSGKRVRPKCVKYIKMQMATFQEQACEFKALKKHLKWKRISDRSQFYLLLWLKVTQKHSSSSSVDDVRTSLLIMGGKQDAYRWKI